MNDFKSIYFLILVRLLSTVDSTYPPEQDSSKTAKGLGKAVCRWYGGLQKACNTSEVAIENLPKQCTSFIYEGIRIDLHKQITDYYSDEGADGTLDELIATKKNVMMFFGHSDQLEWITALNVSADLIESVAKEEMQSVKSYVDQHEGIAGLIFVNLERHELHELTGNLKKYVEVMRNTFPEMEIGLCMESYAPIFYINHPDSKWLDFKMLNCSFDFYVLNLLDINNCTDEFVETGVFPLTGDDSINSLDKIINYLDGVDLPINDLYYDFHIYGTFSSSADVSNASDDSCSTLYPNICISKIKSDKNKLCADTLQSLYEKGQYARAKGRGFITGSIDLDDVDCSCECDSSFPAFYALLAGFDGSDQPPDCPLFNRN